MSMPLEPLAPPTMPTPPTAVPVAPEVPTVPGSPFPPGWATIAPDLPTTELHPDVALHTLLTHLAAVGHDLATTAEPWLATHPAID